MLCYSFYDHNYAAGLTDQVQTHEEVNECMEENNKRIQNLIMKAIDLYEDEDCECRHVLAEYGGFKP